MLDDAIRRPKSPNYRRSMFNLVLDQAAAWAVTRMRRRAKKDSDFGHIVVPVDDPIGHRVMSTGRYESTQIDGVKQLLDGMQGPLGMFVDVGANIGLFTLALSHYFRATLALEMNSLTFGVLQANLALAKAKPHNVTALCVGASDERAETSIYSRTDGSLGWASIGRPPTRGIVSVAATTDTLDNILRNTNTEGLPVSMIKIDVEGHEASVLAGAEGVLQNDGPLVLVEMLDPKQGMRCVEILRGAGYSSFCRFRRATDSASALWRGLPVVVEPINFSGFSGAPLVCASKS